MIRRAGRCIAAGAVLALCACAGPIETAIPVACSEIVPTTPPTTDSATAGALAPPPAVGAKDTLDLFVVLDTVPAGPGSIRVRVDGLAEPGIVEFFMPPPTAAAAAMALQPPETFGGCAAVAPAAIALRAPSAPRAKAWVRVSTDRPVRVNPRAADRGGASVVVLPGTSAIVGWDA